MASKNISISKNIYEALLREKSEGESFTAVISRLLSRRKRLSDSFGAWDMGEEEAAAFKKELAWMWKRLEEEMVE